MPYKKIFLILFLLFAVQASPSISQSKRHIVKQANVTTSVEKLRSDIDVILSAPELKNAFVGAMVLSLDSGEIFYQTNQDKNFVPASVQKLFVTGAALESLGEDYTYNTSLYLDGKLQDNGKFDGNIIIKGNGDPSMSQKFYVNPQEILDAWADKLDSMGIRMITGNIIGDDRFFDSQIYGPGWAWDDVDYTYSAPIGALSFNQNQVSFTFKPSAKLGERAIYECKPNNEYVRAINNVSTVAPKQSSIINVSRDFNSNLFDLSGYIALDSATQANGYSVSASIDNPTLFFLHQFKRELEIRKIKFRGALLDADDLLDKPTYENASPLFEHRSPRLIEILKTMNKQSDNFLAEDVLKTLAKETSGVGSFSKGVELTRNFALKCGALPDNVNFVDGSGLSRMNFCSPRAIVSLLSYMNKSKKALLFSQTLAQPGENGTLKNRMTKSLAQDALKAKTGSMNGVCSIAGYVTTRDGENIAFSLMFMNYSAAYNSITNLQDMICMRLAGFTRKK